MRKILAAAAIVAASTAVGGSAEATSIYCTSSGHTSTCHKSDNNTSLQFTHQERCRGAYGDFTVYGTWKTMFTFNTTAYGPGCPAKTSLLYHGAVARGA
jgi:hypothetical protein